MWLIWHLYNPIGTATKSLQNRSDKSTSVFACQSQCFSPTFIPPQSKRSQTCCELATSIFVRGNILSSLPIPPLQSHSHFNIWAIARQNQQNDLCTQRRLRSAWASVQSDESLRSALNGQLRAQCFFMRPTKTLIRLGRCSGWSESLLGAKVILLVLSWGGSYQLWASPCYWKWVNNLTVVTFHPQYLCTCQWFCLSPAPCPHLHHTTTNLYSSVVTATTDQLRTSTCYCTWVYKTVVTFQLLYSCTGINIP